MGCVSQFSAPRKSADFSPACDRCAFLIIGAQIPMPWVDALGCLLLLPRCPAHDRPGRGPRENGDAPPSPYSRFHVWAFPGVRFLSDQSHTHSQMCAHHLGGSSRKVLPMRNRL